MVVLRPSLHLWDAHIIVDKVKFRIFFLDIRYEDEERKNTLGIRDCVSRDPCPVHRDGQ